MSLSDFEVTILRELEKEPLRFRDLKEKLYPKFKSAQTSKFYYTIETFATILTRKLKKLLKREYVSRLDRGHQNVQYSLDEKGKNKIRELEIAPLISKLDEKWFERLRNMILQIKERKSPENLLENWCFTFIGNIPIGFGKSIMGMESQLANEKNLRDRHRRERERVHDEVEKAYPDLPIKEREKKFFNRVEKEIGWSEGEFFERLMKKVNKEKDPFQKILTFYGITDEMVSEIYTEKKKE